MAYKTNITNPIEGLKMIHDAAVGFNADVFVYALKYSDVDIERLKQLTNYIADYRSRLEREFPTLKRYGDMLNTLYATDFNDHISMANKMLYRIKSCIKMTKNLYKLFCPKQSRTMIRLQKAYGIDTPSIWDHSCISYNSTITVDLFGIDSYSEYSPEIVGCYREMVQFFELLQKSIKYCQAVLKKEASIRKDEEYCVYLYKKQYKKIMETISDIIVGIKEIDDTIIDNNPIFKGRKLYGDTTANIVNCFHKCTPADLRQLALYNAYHDKELMQYPQETRNLFKNDTSMISNAMKVVRNFDHIRIQNGNGKLIGADNIAMFVFWCQTYDVKNTVAFFNKNYSGVYKTIQDSGVYRRFNELKTESDQGKLKDDSVYNQFLCNIEKLFNSNEIPTLMHATI